MFENAKVARDQDKDPAMRYEKFARQAHQQKQQQSNSSGPKVPMKAGRSAAVASGSFGGRPKANKGQGRGGSFGTHGKAPPAWAKGNLEDDG